MTESTTGRGRRAAGRRTRSTDAAAVALGLCLLLLAYAAPAETVSPACPQRPDDAAEARKLAGAWFSKGETLVAEELYSEALGAFNCSLRLFEHPSTMMNAARAAELAGSKAEALELYRRVVVATPGSERAQKAEERIAALEAEIARETPPEPVPAPEPEPAPAPAPEPAPAPVPEGVDTSRLAIPGYVALAVGGAGVVTGAVFSGLAAKAQKEGEETDDYPTYRDRRESLPGLNAGTAVGFAVGGAALVAGVVLVVLSRRPDEEPQDVAAPVEVAVYPGIGGLTVGGTF